MSQEEKETANGDRDKALNPKSGINSGVLSG